jgi:hypothetical protein
MRRRKKKIGKLTQSAARGGPSPPSRWRSGTYSRQTPDIYNRIITNFCRNYKKFLSVSKIPQKTLFF